MKNNDFVKQYAAQFNYREMLFPESIDKMVFMKNTTAGDFVIIESFLSSKYVNFYLNEKSKTFKKSDLFLGVLENTPVAWEAESE